MLDQGQKGKKRGDKYIFGITTIGWVLMGSG